MAQDTKALISRRWFLKTAGATALAAGAGPAVIIPGRAQPKTLKILRVKEYVPSFNGWYEEYVSQWGEQNNIQTSLDLVGGEGLADAVTNNAAWLKTYDLMSLISGGNEDEFIDHRDIYEECERRYGKGSDGVKFADYNPKADRFTRFTLQTMPNFGMVHIQ